MRTRRYIAENAGRQEPVPSGTGESSEPPAHRVSRSRLCKWCTSIAPHPTNNTTRPPAAPTIAQMMAANTATAAGASSAKTSVGVIVGPSQSARDRQTVAAAAHGLDHPVLPERLQRQPQPANVHVDRALLDIHVIAPYLVEQLSARMNAFGPRQKEAQ